MDMKPNLQQTLRPTLIMTQRLQMALKLLVLNTLELQLHLKQELLTNPLLEEVDEVLDQEEQAETPEERAESETPDDEPAESQDKQKEEIDWSDFYQDGTDSSYERAEAEEDDERYERVPVTQMSLQEHLISQLRLNLDDPESIRIGEYIIGCLDDRGFVALAPEDVGAADGDPGRAVLEVIARETGAPVEAVERALAAVQQLEPSGVGARSLQESLLIQLRARDPRGPEEDLAIRIVAERFEDLKNRRFQEIARALKVSPEQVQSAVDVVGALSPSPGSQISGEGVKYVYPDLIVERVGDDYEVFLNDRNVPRLRISPTYERVLRESASNDKTREYVQSKLKSAKWLIQTIEQRRRTMVKVMRCIVKEQREFFEKGIRHLNPLTLQQVASQIDMHESTVSRVTRSKYVQTPRGVFELKFFFSSGIEMEDGDEISARSAKDIIRQLIDQEEKREPLSDQRIADLLHERGLRIARRTVAKYREQIGVPPARYRKRL
jgi:RNA polymerase sigma-54 factor